MLRHDCLYSQKIKWSIGYELEPVSNTVTSVAEDGLVLGGLALIGLFPTIALFVFIGS